MSDKKSNDSRRKVLKSIVAGSGAVVAGKSLPESWSKPVIDSVMLPVHASTTDDTGSGAPGETTTTAPGETTTTTTTTTLAPCDIEGTYCWIDSSNANNTISTTFTVGDNGSISIHRVNSVNNLAWDGTGFASNGSLGGDFDIIALNSGDGRDRRYLGTIVCNSDSISGTVGNSPFTATTGACR